MLIFLYNFFVLCDVLQLNIYTIAEALRFTIFRNREFEPREAFID